ncbi:MAG TPA: hypothetical protein VKU19_04610 [Bryobacteraceae bacterium]|nr:hypothetical protein [Bryobacteraceae bacterium]
MRFFVGVVAPKEMLAANESMSAIRMGKDTEDTCNLFIEMERTVMVAAVEVAPEQKSNSPAGVTELFDIFHILPVARQGNLI